MAFRGAPEISRRFGFLVTELSRLYARSFDERARSQLGLSQAQCRLLYSLAAHEGDTPLSQAELADRVGVSAMAIATMCERLEAGGWITRQASITDRRVNELRIRPKAHKALQDALQIGDRLTLEVLAPLSVAERRQLLQMLGRIREQLIRGDDAQSPKEPRG
ncbi:MarR family winged helix-turn-helix transcriptional regulator [Ramlibacter albus]|uniref:MarR family transcriptional regulator n=1 Tax=Ramlibacter albus TaxID=2079448 RepID=A0A923S3F6_9BURK|nr:MarR family transcriptional regulator [Ramlibacter albus]MBC5763072.1 MarR family transcriptional regulator [Ramlibacter albus]